ncbi:MAG TPA: hypothetical protein VLG67_04285 [Candidatus Saccharimonadales bacterium]|nr:hypothetical protein [Candidatus Saccharimonadales bacterium]
MAERDIPRLDNGRVKPTYARALRAYADPEESSEWRYNPLHSEALEIFAPDKKRPSFQRDVLHPLLLIGVGDLAKKVNVEGGVPDEAVLPLPNERVEGKLIHVGFKVGAYLNSMVDFNESFMLEPEQEVRLARYTVHGQDTDLESFQNDSIEVFFNMANGMMISIVQSALKNGLVREEEIDLKLYAAMSRQPWFKKIILGAMDTGNGFWAEKTPDIDRIESDGIERVINDSAEITQWWNVKAPLPDGPVSVSTTLRTALEDRKAKQQAGDNSTGYLTEDLPTDGCPIRHAKAIYSDDPNDVNFLSEAQISRLTEGDMPLVVRDSNSPNVLHVRFSINSFLLDQYANVLEKVA